MRGPKKKNQRKWEYSASTEEYVFSKKEKEYLVKYKKIAGEYLEDWELSEITKKYNFDDEQISKELNKILLGDEFKWKEIKNGKPVTTRSTDQIRKKKYYYKPEKSCPSYDKTEDETYEQNIKRRAKGSHHKSNNDYFHYVSKKPKRPFQKCIEIPSDYQPPNNKNNQNNQDNKNIINNNNDNNNSNNNKAIINNTNEKENMKPKNNENIDETNRINIKNNLAINKKEIEKNKENIISDEEQKKIILLKGQVFKNLKKMRVNTEIKPKESNNNLERQKENNEDNNKAPGPEIDLNQLRKKYFRDFVGYMKHYPKKMENNIKRASSKDSETSDDRSPETIKRKKRNNIPTSSNIVKKKLIVNNNGINRNLKNTYEIEQNNIEFESKVINISINSCYDNPYREQYLKVINEKKKQNPGKIVEFIIPQFNNPFMQLYPPPYQYNPYMSQNMYMYQQSQYQMQNAVPNSQMNPQINQQMNIPLNQNVNFQMNPQMNMQLNQQMRMQMNSPINSPVNSPINSQNLKMSPIMNQNNYVGMNDAQLLNNQMNNAPNPEHINNSDN